MAGIDRRLFLGSSLGAALASTSPLVKAKTRSDNPSEQIHFALIGAGGQGRHDSGKLLQQPNVRLTAVC